MGNSHVLKKAFFVLVCLVGVILVQSQSNLVGTANVERGSIEIKRVDTDTWVKLTRESIVGVGDRLRTLTDSQATVAFLANQVSMTLKANTEIVIAQLQQQDNVVLVALEQLGGEASHKVTPNTSTPITLEVRTETLSAFTQKGTFSVQVGAENSYVLGLEGEVVVRGGGRVETLKPQTGVGVHAKNGLSAVLPATSVSTLASAIDGIPATLATEIDGLINVRRGASLSQDILGQVNLNEVTRVLGISSNRQWYRIPYKNGAGWISAAGLIIETEVSRLLVFDANYVEVDPVAVAQVPATPTPQAPTAGGNTASTYNILNEYSLSEVTMLGLLNDWRKSVGLAPFKMNATLAKMARDQANYVLSFPTLPSDIHRDANGKYPMERALDKKYNWPFYAIAARMAIGENTYAGASEAVAVKWWQGSTVHKNTIENAGYREIGIVSLPHTYGKLFVIVLGARPDVLPALIDPTTNTMYLSTEQYKFSDGGNWIRQVQEYQILESPLSPINESGWQPFAPTVPAPDKQQFTLALRGGGKVVMTQIDVSENIAWFSSNLPQPQTTAPTGTSGTGAGIFATSTPRP